MRTTATAAVVAGIISVCLAVVLCVPPASAADAPAAAKPAAKAPAKPPEPAYLHAAPDVIANWRKLKFGLFVHWGPVSLKGTEIGWSRGGERRGRKGRGSIPAEVYDNLYKQFNPVKFDADQWVRIAKAAGMRYLVFTSKHHDGFNMFDTKLSDYKITRSPFQRDIVGELAEACHKGGLKLGWYYSPVDWHHPDYRTARHAKYIEYMHGQLRELCSNYGRIDIIWFDGLGGRATDWNSPPLFQMIRQLQPDVIINNRAGLPADFDTPEQRIGRFQTDRPWESCITICRQWAWKPNDKMKSLEQCLHTLIRVVGGDGNLLFNVGPMPTGEIEPRQVKRLEEMGAWLSQYGQTIYETRGGPFRTGAWGAATGKGNTVYLHVLAWPGPTLALPPILNRKIVSAKLLTGGSVKFAQSDEQIAITVAPADRKRIDTIVALELDGPALGARPGKLASDAVSVGCQATASNVYEKKLQYGPAKALDDDPQTRWATDTGTKTAWLAVDPGKEMTIDRALIHEAYAGRVRRFELQRKEGQEWQTFHTGTTLGENKRVAFEPVTARQVRLNILEASEGPTLWEFQLYRPKKTKP